jgi:phosphoribosylamine--glycine ligase
MRYLVVGSGGREHALGWKMSVEGPDNKIWFAPGNGGTAAIGENVDVSPTDTDAITDLARKVVPDLVIIGPEDPLAMGIVDRLEEAGFKVFGPPAQGAALESSKAFAKRLMSKYSVPTAPYKIFTEASKAHGFVDKSSRPLVVKADGLARGKGSIVTGSKEEAHRAIELIMTEKAFGDAGDTVIIEERLMGEEASVLAITDGEHIVVLPPSQDHKPVYDGDRGPNTGGMGAYCPAPIVDSNALGHIEQTILKRILRALIKDDISYKGVIYAGLMINSRGVFVVEFNVRFGDPETQCMLPTIDANLGDLLLQAADGRLKRNVRLEAARWAVSVVAASGGYPGDYEKGKCISGLDRTSQQEDIVVFHAGTKRLDDDRIVTSGGRVLAVTGMGSTLREARRTAYQACRMISFEGMHMRSDIGQKGLKRLRKVGVKC